MNRITSSKLLLQETSANSVHSNLDRISQENWYQLTVAKEVIQIKTETFIWNIPIKKIFHIYKAYIPPFIQRIDPCPVRQEFQVEPDLFEFLQNDIPCGSISLSNPILNRPASFKETKRDNYTLSLNRSYSLLYKDFKNGHKLNLKHSEKFGLKIQVSEDAENFARFYAQYSSPEIPSNYKNKALVKNLLNECIQRNCGFILVAKSNQNEILAKAFFTKYKNRIVYLLSCSTDLGKRNYSMHSILNHVIRTYSEQSIILDFEGSMLPGIAYFMNGFGSTKESYFVYEWNQHCFCKWMQLGKKLFRFKKD